MNKRGFRFFLALYAAKTMQFGLKILKRNATYLPGKLAIKLCPDFLGKIEKPEKIIGVTGTNGKTTVSNMLVDVLTANGYDVLNNRLGSNINSGIASSLILGSNLKGKTKYKIAVFEIDERSSKLIYPYVKPTYIICTNLFRDSIKRNAHTEFISGILTSSIPKESKLILNGDDLICSNIAPENERIYFGINRLETDTQDFQNIVRDIIVCPNCNSILEYDYVRYNHLGKAHCPNCFFASPNIEYLITNINASENRITVYEKGQEAQYHMIANSIFNIYNMLAAITVLREIDVEPTNIDNSLKETKIVETRLSQKEVNGVTIISHLAKGQNPIACSRVFDYVKTEEGNKAVILLLDDLHDTVSSSENITWLYDTDFELLKAENIKQILIGGIRCHDYYLRLLLAGEAKDKLEWMEEEKLTAEKLKLEGITKIFILHDMYKYKTAVEIEKRLQERILGKEEQA